MAQLPRVVLPEGDDVRVQAAARRLSTDGIARPILLTADHDALASALVEDLVDIIVPVNSDHFDRLAQLYADGPRQLKPSLARRLLTKPLYFAGMLVKAGIAEAKILRARQPITRVLADSTVDAATRGKLSFVLEARRFAADELGSFLKEAAEREREESRAVRLERR